MTTEVASCSRVPVKLGCVTRRHFCVCMLHCCVCMLHCVTLQESFVQLGLNRKILNQEPLFNTFARTVPSAMEYLTSLDATLFGVLLPVIKFLTMIGDVPDAMATFKVQMCTVTH